MTCFLFLLHAPLLKTYSASYQFRAAEQGGFGDGEEEGVIDKQLLSTGRSRNWENLMQITKRKGRPSALFSTVAAPPSPTVLKGPLPSTFAPAFVVSCLFK